MAIDIEAEIRDLKRRVSEIEGSFAFLTQQIRGVHKDLLDFEARTEQRFEKVDKRFDGLEHKADGLDRKLDLKIDGLAKALPGIVGDAVRETNRERDKNR
jgi:predicted  nucleic acid-binding Zn-ribbon protein